MLILVFLLELIRFGHSGEVVPTCDLVGLNLCGWKLGQNVSAVYNDEISALPSAEQVKLLCGIQSLTVSFKKGIVRYKEINFLLKLLTLENNFQREFQSCYKDKLAGCNTNMVYITTFATTQKTVEYLCGEGHTDMIKHNKCWIKEIVHNTSNECYNQHIKTVQQQLKESGGIEQDLIDGIWCRILNASKSCMYDTVIDNCGRAAADVVNAMMSKVFENLSMFMQCDDGNLGQLNDTLSDASDQPPMLVIHSSCYSDTASTLQNISAIEMVLILLLSLTSLTSFFYS